MYLFIDIIHIDIIQYIYMWIDICSYVQQYSKGNAKA